MKHASFRNGLATLAFALTAASPALAAQPAASSPVVLTPVQVAFIQAETRRIEEGFIQKVMSITGARRDQVLRAIPAKGRLTDRLARIFSSLERDLAAPLTDEQRALIFAADGERKQALKDLAAQAGSR